MSFEVIELIDHINFKFTDYTTILDLKCSELRHQPNKLLIVIYFIRAPVYGIMMLNVVHQRVCNNK